MKVKTGSEKYPWKNGQRIDRNLNVAVCMWDHSSTVEFKSKCPRHKWFWAGLVGLCWKYRPKWMLAMCQHFVSKCSVFFSFISLGSLQFFSTVIKKKKKKRKTSFEESGKGRAENNQAGRKRVPLMCSCNKICQGKRVKTKFFFVSCLMEFFCLSSTYPVIFFSPSFLKSFELLTFYFTILIFSWLSEMRLPCVCVVKNSGLNFVSSIFT